MRHSAFALLVVLGSAMGCSDVASQTETSKTAIGDEPVGFGFTADDVRSTAEAAESINPLDGDLRNLEAAVQMKEEFRIRSGGVELVLRVTLDNGDVPIDEVFVLEPMAPVASETLAAARDPGRYVRMYRLFPHDRAVMAKAQSKLQAIREKSTGGNQLELSIDVFSCREPSAPPDEPYQWSVFIRTRPDVDFVPLFLNMTMNRDDPQVIPQIWDTCEAQ